MQSDPKVPVQKWCGAFLVLGKTRTNLKYLRLHMWPLWRGFVGSFPKLTVTTSNIPSLWVPFWPLSRILQVHRNVRLTLYKWRPSKTCRCVQCTVCFSSCETHLQVSCQMALLWSHKPSLALLILGSAVPDEIRKRLLWLRVSITSSAEGNKLFGASPHLAKILR